MDMTVPKDYGTTLQEMKSRIESIKETRMFHAQKIQRKRRRVLSIMRGRSLDSLCGQQNQSVPDRS